MRSPVLLADSSARLFVVLSRVHHLPLGALSDEVPAHAGNIFKTMTWKRARWQEEVWDALKITIQIPTLTRSRPHATQRIGHPNTIVTAVFCASAAPDVHTLTLNPKFKSQPGHIASVSVVPLQGVVTQKGCGEKHRMPRTQCVASVFRVQKVKKLKQGKSKPP